MPTTTCNRCGSEYDWSYEEAFDKFGFGDGDLRQLTGRVRKVLAVAGYSVETCDFLMHNTVIASIKKDGRELIPEQVMHGYDDPHDYLPVEIIQLLEEADYV